jgi:hypothetical protein
MKTPTYEECSANPSAVLEQVERRARRQRAEALHQLIVVPLKQLFKSAPNLQPRTA